MVQINFDASQISPDTGFETIPAGWYNVCMDESEMKPTKDGAGAYLKCRFDVLDGQYKGRKVYTNLNIRNANPQTVEIAFKQLSAIAHAVGILQVQDTQHLHGRPLKIKVSLRKDTTGQYEDQNDIKMFKNINEQVDMGSQAPAPQTQQGNFVPPQQSTQQFQPPAQQQQFQPPVQQQQPPQQQTAPQFQQQPPQQQFQQPPQQQQAPQQEQQWAPPGQNAQQPWEQPAQQQAPQFQQQQPQQQQQPAQQPAQQQQPHPAQTATPPWQPQS